MLRLILINIRNTLILLALVYFSIPIVSDAWSAIEPLVTQADKRSDLPNYKSEPWAKQHFKEFRDVKAQSDYHRFVIWRHKRYAGQTLNIDKNGMRVTPPIAGLPLEPAVYFFGGSAMWGEGASDETTIPAYFQALSRETSINYAEGGWTAHQSLNQLMEVMSGEKKPTVVIFYDGVNEILAKCSRGNDYFSHLSEKHLRDELEYRPTEIGYYWQPVKAAVKTLSTEIFGRNPENRKVYDCDADAKKAEQVAEALLRDWTVAKYVAESNGARFYAFLQPVSFLSKTKLSQLPPEELDPELGKQYEVVYPLIRAKMKERQLGYDMSIGPLDIDDFLYVDFCHLSPNGNKIVAEAIQKVMAMPAQAQLIK